MELVRIGDKVVDKGKIISAIDKIIESRQKGLSQLETAKKFGLDRSTISRIEQLGEVRKGKRIALIGFPILNKMELLDVAQAEGVELTLLMTESERWSFVKDVSGLELFNKLMELTTLIRSFDVVIVIGSNYRIEVIRAMLGKDNLIGIEIGKSPLVEDQYLDPVILQQTLTAIKQNSTRGKVKIEASS